jgi:hypothetical protein
MPSTYLACSSNLFKYEIHLAIKVYTISIAKSYNIAEEEEEQL